MPSLTGGSQLDAEYAPWAKAKLSIKEREAIKSIEAAEKELDKLEDLRDKLIKKIEKLRMRCKHRNITARDSMFGGNDCVDCGKENV